MWRITIILMACGVCGLIGCATTTAGDPSIMTNSVPTGFINKAMTIDKQSVPYVVYVPRDYDAQKPSPVVLFLHGAGERGDDGLKQSDVGIGRAIRMNPDRFPCIVVFPQCPEGVWWDGASKRVQTAFTQTLAEYNIDPQRMYLSGLSMGGYGTWIFGADQADLFAALMPVCGGGRVEDAAKLAKIPIWAFHGEDDSVVKAYESRRMVEAVQEAGGLVKYTEFPDTDHNSWDQAYGEPGGIEWLLSQRKQ